MNICHSFISGIFSKHWQSIGDKVKTKITVFLNSWRSVCEYFHGNKSQHILILIYPKYVSLFSHFLLVYCNLQNYFPSLPSFILMIMDVGTVNIMICIKFCFVLFPLGKSLSIGLLRLRIQTFLRFYFDKHCLP